MFTQEEIRLLLELLAASSLGEQLARRGYSDDPVIGKLQAKLSIMLEVASTMKKKVGANE